MRLVLNKSLNSILVYVKMFLTISVLFGANGILLGYNTQKIFVIGIIEFFLLTLCSTQIKINKDNIGILLMYIFILVYLGFSLGISYSANTTKIYLIRFICLFFILVCMFDINIVQKEILWAKRISIFVGIVYILSWPIAGVDSGIYGNYQNTARIASMSLGFFFPNLFNGKKWDNKNLLSIAILFLTILITGKRTLFVIPVFMLAFVGLISSDKKKIRKIVKILLLSLFVGSILIICVPSVMNSITRLLETSQDKTMNSRVYYWAYAMMLWRSNPLFGIGFGCFPNHIANASNLEKYGYVQAFLAHNIYYEMLAEIGIIGFLLFTIFFLTCTCYTAKIFYIVKKNKLYHYESIILVSIYIQLWFLIYGYTGNTLYMITQVFAYVWSISIMCSVKHELAQKGYYRRKRVMIGIEKITRSDLKMSFGNKIICCISIFLLFLFAVMYSVVNERNYTDDVTKMVSKAEQFWEKGEKEKAIDQLSMYCYLTEYDDDVCTQLIKWCKDSGDQEQYLYWSKVKTENDKISGELDIELTALQKESFINYKWDSYEIEYIPSAEETISNKLIFSGDNLLNEYVQGSIVNSCVDLLNDNKLTSSWIRIMEGQEYLTLYGEFNMSEWQFADKDMNILLTPIEKVNEKKQGVEYIYNSSKSSSMYNLLYSTVKIPDKAKYVRVTFLDKDKQSESIVFKNNTYLVYGKGILADCKSIYKEIDLPNLISGDKVIYKNGEWSLLREQSIKKLEIDSIDINDYATIMLDGELLGRVNISGEMRKQDASEKQYGVRWKRNENNPVCERVGDSIGLHFNYCIGDEMANDYINDFDSIYPWSEIKLCAINRKNEIKYGNDSKELSQFGDVFVEIPYFYVKREIIGDYEYLWISKEEKDGYQIDPAFLSTDGINEKIYVAAYKTAIDKEGKLVSKNEYIPIINYSLKQIKESLISSNELYQELDIFTLMMLQRLFLVETGVKNSQLLFAGASGLNFFNADDAQCAINNEKNSNEIIISQQRRFNVGDAVTVVTKEEWDNFNNSYGVTQRTIVSVERIETGKYKIKFTGVPIDIIAGKSYIYNLPRKNGTTDELNYCTGVIEGDEPYMNSFKYRYMENLWANGAVLLEGIYEYMNNVYVIYPNGKEVALNYTLPRQNYLPGNMGDHMSETIVKELGFDSLNPLVMLPSTLGDGSTLMNGFGDTFYLNDNIGLEKKKRLFAYGGCWDVNNYAGFFNYRVQVDESEQAKENTSRMIYRYK